MPHEHPMPYEYDGNKTWLDEHTESGSPTVRAISRAAMYLGEILEHICFELQRQGTKRPSYGWYPEHPPGHPEEH